MTPKKIALIICLFVLVSVDHAAFAQPQIVVQLTVVSRQAGQDVNKDVGLLVDVKNTTGHDIALYTPSGSLVNYIKYYKLDGKTHQYQEIIHPLVQEPRDQMAFKDSIFKASQMIVDFLDSKNYNSKSTLYLEFTESDSLWFDYITRSEQYSKQIQETEVQYFKTASGSTDRAFFTLLKAHEHYQDFFNIAFLYQAKGDYKIVLDLPPTRQQQAVHLAGTFAVTEPEKVSGHPVYLSIR
ncbi:hypothetical protein ACFQ4C_17740 [Larkinella insperata]|uniref:DUF4138 domain-containing protein n=1 Tax=Larkinella insperata TaxID=332158 RepID=A0ABW3Q5W9_9BACT|nr:hypothetical protein [Larkinella insperata]